MRGGTRAVSLNSSLGELTTETSGTHFKYVSQVNLSLSHKDGLRTWSIGQCTREREMMVGKQGESILRILWVAILIHSEMLACGGLEFESFLLCRYRAECLRHPYWSNLHRLTPWSLVKTGSALEMR